MDGTSIDNVVDRVRGEWREIPRKREGTPGAGRVAARGRRNNVAQRADEAFPQRSSMGARALLDAEVSALGLTSEIGSSGVGRDWMGRPLMEDNPELNNAWARGLGDDHGVFHEMSRGDAAIAGTLAIFKREILRATYRVTTELDATPLELEAADLVERTLGLGKWSRTGGWFAGGFLNLLARGCDAFTYGFSPNEIVLGCREWNGRPVIVPVGAPWRAPWSVSRWFWKGDRLLGMGQRVRQGTAWATVERRAVIPVDRLLMFVHDYRTGNPEGTSILRPAWLPWRAKRDTILRQQEAEDSLYGGVVTLEASGTDDNGPAPWCTDDNAKKFREVFADWVTDRLDWLHIPYGWTVRDSHPEFEIPSRVAELRYYDHQIFLSGLAALLGLDASHAASKALSDGLGAVLYRGLDSAVRSTILPTLNGVPGLEWTGLVRRIVDLNFEAPQNFRYPTIDVIGLDAPDVSEYVSRTTAAAAGGLVRLNDDDRDDFRRLNGMRAISRVELDEVAEDGTAVALPGESEKVADAALNGAQVTSLLSLLTAVATGQIPPRAAEIAILQAFPTFSNEDAAEMVASAAAGTIPTEPALDA